MSLPVRTGDIVVDAALVVIKNRVGIVKLATAFGR
jgi:hypothetical protein